LLLSTTVTDLGRTGLWRAKFALWYTACAVHRSRLERLLPHVEEAFRHPWVDSVELHIGRGGVDEFKTAIYRDAPVTLTIYRATKRGPREALCMSLFTLGGGLSVNQLQGVARQDIPADLRDWPARFVVACQRFAIAEGYRTVCVAKADTLAVCRDIDKAGALPPMSADERDRLIARVVARYDGTARALGFVEGRKWFVWHAHAANAHVANGSGGES
jgi:hypothetical protein